MLSRLLRSTPPSSPAGRGDGGKSTVVPVRDETARAVLALAVAAGVLPLLGEMAVSRPTARFLRDDAEDLARGTAARILGAADAPSADEVAEAAEDLLETLAFLGGMKPGRAFPASLEKVPVEGLELAGLALREQALEHHASELMLASRDAEHVAVCAPATEAQAHLWLLDPLYRRVERWVAEHRTPALEREAARWWFSRWRAPRPLPVDEFARGVREQEFSLVERDYACLGVSALAYMVEDDLLGGAGPRQRHVARQLLDSRVGIWSVAMRRGEEAVFLHPLEGTRFRVREHAAHHDYGPGAVVLGRLIPFGGGMWLRSPGALIIPRSQVDASFAEHLAKALEVGSRSMYPEAALEMIIHSIRGVRGLPRTVRPDLTPDEAAEVLRDLNQGLHKAGAAEPVDPHSSPEAREMFERSAARSENATLYRSSVDVVLAEYFSALFPLSKKSKAMRDTLRRRERDAKKRKGGR